MKSQFRQIALIGKYHQPIAGGHQASSRQVLERVNDFLHAQGCEVVLENETAAGSGIGGGGGTKGGEGRGGASDRPAPTSARRRVRRSRWRGVSSPVWGEAGTVLVFREKP